MRTGPPTGAFVSCMQGRSTPVRALPTPVRDVDGQYRRPTRQYELTMAPTLGTGTRRPRSPEATDGAIGRRCLASTPWEAPHRTTVYPHVPRGQHWEWPACHAECAGAAANMSLQQPHVPEGVPEGHWGWPTAAAVAEACASQHFLRSCGCIMAQSCNLHPDYPLCATDRDCPDFLSCETVARNRVR